MAMKTSADPRVTISSVKDGQVKKMPVKSAAKKLRSKFMDKDKC